ncbi:MAG: glycosyltransferase [Verrucomicrobiaceae bacterium]|nr:glycosyltransferase [Verrucomicrobiaceae bacterium]
MPDSVLLIIPCYRESGRIGPFLDELATEMARVGRVSIRVVEDGSGAQEQQAMSGLLAPYLQKHAFIRPPLMLAENHGKGGAIYSAWREEKEAAWLAFVDADGSCSAAEVARLIGIARSSPPRTAVIASRVKMLGRHVERDWRRHVLGRIYATVVSILLDLPVYDSQCGLKLVPRADFERIASLLHIHGFAFDVELLTTLLDSGCTVREEPISWHEIPGGKVRFLRDPLLMARDVWHVRQRRGQ